MLVLSCLESLLILGLLYTTLRYRHLSQHDSFTGCYNKNWLMIRKNSKLVQMMKKSKKERINFGILLIDIDNFKTINDQNSHIVGDKIILQVVNIIKEQSEKIGFTSRYGGDEFIVVYKDINNIDQLKGKAENIRSLVELNTNTSISVGGSLFKYVDDINVKELFNKIDTLMYEAKKEKNKCVIH